MKKVVSSLLCVYLVLGIICSSGFMYLFASRRIGPPAIPQAETRYYGTSEIIMTDGTGDIVVTDGGSYEDINEYVFYDHVVNTTVINPNGIPCYFASGMSNACAVTAGGIVVGYFDKFYEELIPNHTGYIFAGDFTYGPQDDEVDAMHRDLAQRMGLDSQGTTVSGYVNGLGSYIRSKDRSPSIISAYNYNNLDLEACMDALEQGKLVTLFMNGFSVVPFGGVYTENGFDTIMNIVFTGRHAVTAYGYMLLDYYDYYDNLIQSDIYFYCYTGLSMDKGYIRLSRYTTVEDAYVINIT